MEEYPSKKIFMLVQQLSEQFNDSQWNKIRQVSPAIFLSTQKQLKTKLISNQQLYNKYFAQFYSNHIKLFHWSMLAVENKSEIVPYVFRELVSNNIRFYNEKIKEVFQNRFRKISNSKVFPDSSKIKNLQEEVYTNFFNDLLVRNRIEHSQKPLNLKLYGKKINREEEDHLDSHDFYIKTFNACNGWKYIFYNYEKHMKGQSQKCKYNDKIRNKQNKSSIEYRQKDKLNLLSFEQEKENPSQCAIAPVKKILRSKAKNSYAELKRMSRSEVKKIVVVNHQGKPITYRVNRQLNLRA